MQFRTGVAKAFGITFAAPNPAKDEVRIRAVIEAELAGQLAGEVKISRREAAQQTEGRPWYAQLLDPRIRAAFIYEAAVPLQTGGLKLALAVSDNGHIGTVIGLSAIFQIPGNLSGQASLDDSGNWSGVPIACELLTAQPALTKAFREQLRSSYALGNMVVSGVEPRLTLQPSGAQVMVIIDSLPDTTWGGRPILGLGGLAAAGKLLEDALRKV